VQWQEISLKRITEDHVKCPSNITRPLGIEDGDGQCVFVENDGKWVSGAVEPYP
jgi:hypothetical protein